MLKLKAPLIIAGATCVLSMLIGLISGVRFLSILGRGLIAGVGAGSFVLCARIILERFIPDLFAPPAPSETVVDTADISSGANINITLDDGLGASPITAGDNAEPDGMPNASKPQVETQSTGAVSTAPVSDFSGAGTTSENTDFSASSPLSFDEGSTGDSSLSDLPNMGSFIDDDDDFEETVDDGIQADSSGFTMSGIQTGGADSKVMAQAIRTVLATED